MQDAILNLLGSCGQLTAAAIYEVVSNLPELFPLRYQDVTEELDRLASHGMIEDVGHVWRLTGALRDWLVAEATIEKAKGTA